MNPTFSLVPDAVRLADASGKDAILALLAEVLASAYGLDAGQVLDGLEERERLGSTGFGEGVALPHARLDGLTRPVAALLRLSEPVDFAAADGMPVNLVVGLLSPANAGATHLHALAALSRVLRDDAIHQALVEATDSDTLYALLANATDRDVA